MVKSTDISYAGFSIISSVTWWFDDVETFLFIIINVENCFVETVIIFFSRNVTFDQLIAYWSLSTILVIIKVFFFLNLTDPKFW